MVTCGTFLLLLNPITALIEDRLSHGGSGVRTGACSLTGDTCETSTFDAEAPVVGNRPLTVQGSFPNEPAHELHPSQASAKMTEAETTHALNASAPQAAALAEMERQEEQARAQEAKKMCDDDFCEHCCCWGTNEWLAHNHQGPLERGFWVGGRNWAERTRYVTTSIVDWWRPKLVGNLGLDLVLTQPICQIHKRVQSALNGDLETALEFSGLCSNRCRGCDIRASYPLRYHYTQCLTSASHHLSKHF